MVGQLMKPPNAPRRVPPLFVRPVNTIVCKVYCIFSRIQIWFETRNSDLGIEQSRQISEKNFNYSGSIVQRFSSGIRHVFKSLPRVWVSMKLLIIPMYLRQILHFKLPIWLHFRLDYVETKTTAQSGTSAGTTGQLTFDNMVTSNRPKYWRIWWSVN